MCNHNINNSKNTLELIPLLKMVYPPKKYFRCKECGRIFNFFDKEIKNTKTK